jgi:uncharacterized damage-inducible protein DinB
MRAAEIQELYDYNAWANDLVLRAAGRLTTEQFTAPAPVSFGSLCGTLVHLLSAEWTWRMRCSAGISPDALLDEASFPTFAALQARFALETAQLSRFVAGLDDAALDRRVRYTNTKGTPFETPLWQVLLHVVNHGTQFRSEAAVVLTTYGASPGDLDLIGFLREKDTPYAG